MSWQISVIVPTYRRPEFLKKCLVSLLSQSRKPDEIIVVRAEQDEAARQVISVMHDGSGQGIRIRDVLVQGAHIVRAENCGLRAASGDIVCFIDDDAVASPDWIALISRHYQAKSDIGGVGGPVIPCIGGQPLLEKTATFARINWYGKRVTNSTKIPAAIQEVDLLRGANMSFRRTLIPYFDENLLPYWRRFEDDVCMGVKEKGYRVICDPDIRVYHADEASHGGGLVERDRRTIVGLHHNSIYVKMKHFHGIPRVVMIAHEFLWGEETTPGLAAILIRILFHAEFEKVPQLWWVFQGKCKGCLTFVRYRLRERSKEKKQERVCTRVP